MKMSNSLSATRDYFNSLNSKIGEPLAFLLNQNIHDGSDILVTEQVIQDFLASAFQPFVGAFRVPTYIHDQAPLSFHQLAESSQSVIEGTARFGLIGAHYRSSLSAKGRRSAFAVNRRVHCKSLRNFLGDHPYFALRGRLSSDALDALWEAVFLEQYFSLFDRKLTLGEWTFEHNKKIPIVILSESGASSAKIAAFRAESYFKQVVVLPTHLTNILLNDEMLAEFMRGVADGICSSFKRDAEAVRRSGEGYPTSANINSWSRLVRSANALARDAISRTTLERQLAIRHSYATGLLLYNDSERRLRDQLHLLFPSSTTGSPGRDGLVEVEQLSRLLRVFQSLQFYTRRYGENCVTLPQPVANRGRRLLGEGFQSSVTLFWNGGHHLSLLREIDSGVRGLLGHVTALVDGYLRDRRPGRGNMRNQDRDVVERIQKDSDNRLAGQEVHEVLAIAHDLSRALHEGRPRAFSFILGSPEWLIADLAVVHDLMIGNRYQFADNPNQRHAYARTIAILRGNSAFFQDESVALFIPSPGLPLVYQGRPPGSAGEAVQV